MKNYFDVRREIVIRILNHPTLGSLIPPNRRSHLESMKNSDYDKNGFDFLCVKFESEGTSIDLDIEYNSTVDDVYPIDLEGNQYDVLELKFKLNHPLHGATEINKQLARFCFWERVAHFGVELSEDFSEPVKKVLHTAEELVQKEHAKKADEVNARIKALIAKSSSHMRVGHHKTVITDRIPQGNYANCCVDSKSFHLEVQESTDKASTLGLGKLVRVT